MKVFTSTLVVLLAASQAAPAAMISPLTITSEDVFPHQRWAYGQGTAPKGEAPEALLAMSRKAELDGDGEVCIQKAEAAFAKSKPIQPWIANAELTCVPKLKPSSGDRAVKAIARVEQNPSWLASGPHASVLRASLIKAMLWLLENDQKSNRARAQKTFAKLEPLLPQADEKTRARAWRAAGELAFAEPNLEAAREFFRRSLAEQDSEDVRLRMATVESGLSAKAPAKPADAAAAPTPAAPIVAPPSESSDGEIELVDRVTNELKSGDLVTAVTDAVKLIRHYPGGTRAKWAADRAMEAYSSVAEKTDAKLQLSHLEIVKQMAKADGDRVAEWAHLMYNRGQWEDALVMSQAALESVSGARSTAILDLSASAALALDRFDLVRTYCERLVQQHAGTPQSRSALLHLGLLRYRLGKYSEAVADFERLLALPQVGQLEITARYWLWRSLEKSKSDRADAAADELMRKAPFSYYGLRARLDRNAHLLEWKPETSKLTTKFWLTENEKKTWERARLLLKAGWLDEAQAEIKTLPQPKLADDKAIFSLLWASAGQYVNAAKLANDAWDEKPALRRPPFVDAAFPREFTDSIAAQSASRKLDPRLVRSLIKQESSFNVHAVSGSGALGLMQMIPRTAREIAQDLRLGTLALPDDMFQPPRNIQMGTYYFARLLNRYQGHVPLALAAYNAGPARIDRWLKSRPSLKDVMTTRSSSPDAELWFDEIPYMETSIYVKSILRNLLVYRMLDVGRVQVSDPIWAPLENEKQQ